MGIKVYKFWGIVAIMLSVLAVIDGFINKHYLILAFLIPQILIMLYNIKNYEKKSD